MKNLVFFLVFLISSIFLSPDASAQAVDKVLDKGIDKVEQGLKNVFKKKDKKDQSDSKAAETKEAKTETDQSVGDSKQPATGTKAEATPTEATLSWSKYDFVPGDAVIFEDNLQNEENGEFPSRWDLERGNIEIAQFDGEKVIMMRDGQPTIVPYFKDPKKDYLPDVFTIELDLYYPGSGVFDIYLYDQKNQESGSSSGYTDLSVYNGNEMRFSSASSKYPGKKDNTKGWMHISIAYTDGKLKAYMDDTRLINIPRLDFNPRGLTLFTYHASNDNLFYVKNVRIAKGGVKYYDQVMQDGKIIVNGIRFDLNKSTLKPESMGVINEIYTMMKDNPDLKFSVEGHTDNQGDDAFNMKLSQERAETVMNTLVKMGVSADRLTAKGWGESKPISNNASPEDMANNRRVEFVKI
jgi:outer membrane protein OmpA-like peptidoglycan-associated protein